MNKLLINLKNCYGIGEFRKEFDFTKSNTALIYAPNGTMKTSFARALDCVARGESPKDELYQERQTVCEVKIDDTAVEESSILVVNAENNHDSNEQISLFLASKELKDKYDAIYVNLDSIKGEFIKKLKQISQSTDCEEECISTFSQSKDDTFYIILMSIRDELNSNFEKFDFRYNDVFDKKGNVKKFLDTHPKLLDQYFKEYQKLISNSQFFKKSKNTFGTFQANEILKSTNDDSFFDAGHKFVLSGGIEIYSSKELTDFIDEEIKKIIDDNTLKKTFNKIDKAIGTNTELRTFKSVIEKNNLLLTELKEYDGFKKKVWRSYLSCLLNDVDELISLYNEKKGELGKIIEEAKKEQSVWTEIINIFNSRFYVPFKINLVNQEDIILKQKTANLEFEYCDKIGEPLRIEESDTLLRVLSKGEQRAYYILHFLFEIEAKKAQKRETLLIFDDVADSFDYKNKYAIIEYIKDIHESGLFKSIILTHNFDFYRTIASRLSVKRDYIFMSLKDEERKISLGKGQYIRDVFKYYIKEICDQKKFISLIPFVRNIVEYTKGQESGEYEKLTCCVHIKMRSKTITSNDILDIYKEYIKDNNSKKFTINFGDKNIIELIIGTADGIIEEKNADEILLENKIVLAIATRIRAEQYMINLLPDFDITKITSNQTIKLFSEFKKRFPQHEKLLTLDKVNLMTPENIHINAFMYEPLIDMSFNHLKKLYLEVKELF